MDKEPNSSAACTPGLPRAPPDLSSSEAKQLCMSVLVLQAREERETAALCASCISLAGSVAHHHPIDQTSCWLCLCSRWVSPGYLQMWWVSHPWVISACLKYVGLSPLSRFLAWKMSVMDNILNVSMSATFVSNWIMSGFWVVRLCGRFLWVSF